MTLHPKLDDDGEPVTILHPSTPTGSTTWSNPNAVATWTPVSSVPEILNDVPVAPWSDAPASNEAWSSVAGQIDLDEPPMVMKKNLKPASGCVVVEPDGRIWIVAPTNAHGGYKTTFPKGKNDDNLPLQANAIREAWEESGLRVVITGLLGDFERTTSVTRYYLAKRIGGSPADMGWESQAVSLVPVGMLPAILTSPADKPVIKALAAALNKEP